MKKIALFGVLILSFFLISCASQYKYENGMYAKITTNKGDIMLSLTYKKTPLTVANFICLAEGLHSDLEKPFYDGLSFHRVIPNFMIQGGCPNGNGTGDPGYKFPDEFDSTLRHDTSGVLSMANSGPNTNGSQFFITHNETPWLDDKHSVFGYVVDENSQSVVNSISQGDLIEKVEIVRKGKNAKSFDALKVFTEGLEEMKRLEEIKQKKMESSLKELAKDAITTDSGLQYIMIKEGSGPSPKKGDNVSVHYTGYLLDGTKFDSSLDRGEPITFPLGTGRVIKGWDEGIGLLNLGAKAKFIIPADLAYGSRAMGPIPANATLIFEVELVNY